MEAPERRLVPAVLGKPAARAARKGTKRGRWIEDHQSGNHSRVSFPSGASPGLTTDFDDNGLASKTADVTASSAGRSTPTNCSDPTPVSTIRKESRTAVARIPKQLQRGRVAMVQKDLPLVSSDSFPQAWAERSAQAGLLRVRFQCEKSQGFGDRVPELSSDRSINQNRWQKCVSLSTQPAFHAEPVHFREAGGRTEISDRASCFRDNDTDNVAPRNARLPARGWRDHAFE